MNKKSCNSFINGNIFLAILALITFSVVFMVKQGREVYNQITDPLFFTIDRKLV